MFICLYENLCLSYITDGKNITVHERNPKSCICFNPINMSFLSSWDRNRTFEVDAKQKGVSVTSLRLIFLDMIHKTVYTHTPNICLFIAGQVEWKVEGEWVGVPLARTRHGGGHPFLLYSHYSVLFSLGFSGTDKILTLAWDPHHARIHATSSTSDAPSTIAGKENTLRISTTTPAAASASLQPLPHFTAYLLRLVCEGVGVVGEGVSCELRVSAVSDGDSYPFIFSFIFFIIQHLGLKVRWSINVHTYIL